MANNKSKIGFGNSSGIEAAKQQGLIDKYDLLLLDGDTDSPKVGWIDAAGNTIIVTDEKADLSALEAEVAEINLEVDAVDAKVSVVESGLKEVNAEVGIVGNKVSAVETEVNAVAKAVDVVEASCERIKYSIANVPEGTQVDYREDEIRVFCPENTEWKQQNVGANGNANMYYMSFYAYAPAGAKYFKEGDRGVIIDEEFTFDGPASGVDAYGRKYSVCWLALASYSEANGWTYFGKNSSTEKYIGWDYVVEWYDENRKLIGSDSIRINLSNAECHKVVQPYYVSYAIKDMKAYCDEQISEKAGYIPVVEF